MKKDLSKTYQVEGGGYIHESSREDDCSQYLYTFDLGASASLITAGFELVTLDKSNPRKSKFIFRKTNGIDRAVDEYWSNRLEVKARAFFDNVKMLKNRIYSD